MASGETLPMNGATSNHAPASGGIEGSIIQAESIRAICDQFSAQDQNSPILDLSLCEAVAAEVEYRLRQIAQDALKFMSASCRTRMTCADIDSALRLRNIPALYGFRNSSSTTLFCTVPGDDDLFYVADPVLSLSNILAAPLPAAPPDSTFSVHWLAVQGIQPCIPQNPAPTLAAPPIHEVDEKNSSSTIVRPPVRHVLSKEQQMYYDQVTLGIRSGDEALEKAVLQSVSRDPGLHQLLPYLVQFVADQVNTHLRDLPQLWSVIRLAQALIYSPHLRIEPYLHQIMPPILTCLVGRHLCYDCTQDHWALRDYAAGLVAYICKKFGPSYQTLQPRISKTLAKAFLDPDRPLTTHYGAIQGLQALGDSVTGLLILPYVRLFYKMLEPELSNASNPGRRIEAEYCQGALLRACGTYVRNQILSESESFAGVTTMSSLDDLEDLFGEALHPFLLSREDFFVTANV